MRLQYATLNDYVKTEETPITRFSNLLESEALFNVLTWLARRWRARSSVYTPPKSLGQSGEQWITDILPIVLKTANGSKTQDPKGVVAQILEEMCQRTQAELSKDLFPMDQIHAEMLLEANRMHSLLVPKQNRTAATGRPRPHTEDLIRMAYKYPHLIARLRDVQRAVKNLEESGESRQSSIVPPGAQRTAIIMEGPKMARPVISMMKKSTRAQISTTMEYGARTGSHSTMGYGTGSSLTIGDGTGSSLTMGDGTGSSLTMGDGTGSLSAMGDEIGILSAMGKGLRREGPPVPVRRASRLKTQDWKKKLKEELEAPAASTMMKSRRVSYDAMVTVKEIEDKLESIMAFLNELGEYHAQWETEDKNAQDPEEGASKKNGENFDFLREVGNLKRTPDPTILKSTNLSTVVDSAATVVESAATVVESAATVVESAATGGRFRNGKPCEHRFGAWLAESVGIGERERAGLDEQFREIWNLTKRLPYLDLCNLMTGCHYPRALDELIKFCTEREFKSKRTLPDYLNRLEEGQLLTLVLSVWTDAILHSISDSTYNLHPERRLGEELRASLLSCRKEYKEHLQCLNVVPVDHEEPEAAEGVNSDCSFFSMCGMKAGETKKRKQDVWTDTL